MSQGGTHRCGDLKFCPVGIGLKVKVLNGFPSVAMRQLISVWGVMVCCRMRSVEGLSGGLAELIGLVCEGWRP